MTTPKPKKRSREASSGRSRSFGGCATCRQRHLKCDERKPTCLMCDRFGVPCAGYEKSIIFTSEEDDGVERFRRPLYTEEERERMSACIASSLQPQTTLLNILSQIDEECEGAVVHASGDLYIRRGPFGAFKLLQTAASQLNSDETVESLALSTVVAEDCFSPSAYTFSPQTQAMFEAIIQDSEHLIEMDLSDDISLAITHPRIEEMLDEVTPVREAMTPTSPLLSLSNENLQLTSWSDPVQSLPLAVARPAVHVPESAVHLLKHYSTVVIGLLTPSRQTKTLWHVLFLPQVKTSLAALSLGENLDHASLSSFYGTLAISAFHLKAASRSQYWYDEARQHKQRAREHIRLALRTAYHIPKVAKYKSMLMALLTMVQLSMFDGDWKQTECYLLEAEKFIRLRGLPRRKSRKRRLLHHCYAFMRLLHESLFTIANHSLQRTHVRLAVESSGLVITGQDSSTFKLSSWRNLVQKMLEVKDPEVGQNDLHLEFPGLFSATMYPEIYGLPEEWLVMLSQVIRLGNQKDPPESEVGGLSLKEFSTRAKDLERCIINWQRPPAAVFCADQAADDVDERVLHPLLDALHQSLIIYFYRRIYDVDASILEKRIILVRDHLLLSDEADPGRIRYTTVFMWPAFIAACEAEEDALRDTFASWFDDCVVHSGQSSFKHMYAIVKQVWTERSRLGGSDVSWLDLMKRNNIIQ